MEKVRELATVKPIVQDELVLKLEELLEAAKQGSIISLAYGGETATGSIVGGYHTSHPKTSLFRLVGMLDYQKRQLCTLIEQMD